MKIDITRSDVPKIIFGDGTIDSHVIRRTLEAYIKEYCDLTINILEPNRIRKQTRKTGLDEMLDFVINNIGRKICVNIYIAVLEWSTYGFI